MMTLTISSCRPFSRKRILQTACPWGCTSDRHDCRAKEDFDPYDVWNHDASKDADCATKVPNSIAICFEDSCACVPKCENVGDTEMRCTSYSDGKTKAFMSQAICVNHAGLLILADDPTAEDKMKECDSIACNAEHTACAE